MEMGMSLRILILMFIGCHQGIYSREIGNHKGTADDFKQHLSRYRRQSNPRPKCGSMILSSGDVITSPRHPLPYANNRYCVWLVRVQDNQVIHIRFESMDITRGRSNRCDPYGDFLQIQEMDRTGDLIGFYCGKRLPEPVISKSNEVRITFHSDADGSRAGEGFKLIFTAMDPPSSVEGIHLNEFQLETGIANIGEDQKSPATTKTKATERITTEGHVTRMISTITEEIQKDTDTLITEASATSASKTKQQREGTRQLDNTIKTPLITEASGTSKDKTTQQRESKGQLESTSKTQSITEVLETVKTKAIQHTDYEGQSNVTNTVVTVMEERSTILATTIPTERTSGRNLEQLQTSSTNWKSTEQRNVGTLTEGRSTAMERSEGQKQPATTSKKPATTISQYQPKVTSKMPTVAIDATDGRVIEVPDTHDNQREKPAPPARCGDVFVEPSGNFTSPLYPHLYDKNMICTWTILADPLEYIGLRFTDFDIDNPMPNGVCDTMYSNVRIAYFDSEGFVASDQFCGSVLPLDIIVSYSNQMVVYFFSKLGYGKGFVAEYDTFNPDPAIDGAPVFPERHLQPGDDILYPLYSSHDWPDADPDDISDTCGDLIEKSGTIFASPGYPTGYGILSCLWVIVAEPGQDVKLEFKHFNVGMLSEDDTCDSSPALVQVSYYDAAGYLMSKELCGEIEDSSVITSMSHQMYVSFTSKRGGEKGFRAEVIFLGAETDQNGMPVILPENDIDDSGQPYQFYNMKNVAAPSPDTNFCQQVNTGCCYDVSDGLPYGTIVSPGYPDGYNQYLNCKWVIQGDYHQSISLHFTDFQLDSEVGEDGHCFFDESLVRVVYFDDNHAMQEQFLCGHSQPTTVESDFHTLYVEFYTFAAPKTSNKGFTAVYLKEDKDVESVETSFSIDLGLDVRGFFPYLPVGNVVNDTLVLPEHRPPDFTGDDNKESSEVKVTLKPVITKRPRVTKRKKPEVLTKPIPSSEDFQTSAPSKDDTDLEDKRTELPWSELEDMTVNWSASFDYDSVEFRVTPEPITALAASPIGSSSDVEEESSGYSPVTEPLEKDMVSSVAVTLINGTPLSETELAITTENPQNEHESSGESPSPRTTGSHDIFTTRATQVYNSRTPNLDDQSHQVPSEEASNSTLNGTFIDIGGRVILVPVIPPPDSPKQGSVDDDGENQTRVVTLICASVGSALLLILFIVLVYYAFAKRHASDSMDLAKERTNYWQSYQAFDAPEWLDPSRGMGPGNDRVQQEPPEGIGIQGPRRTGRGETTAPSQND